MTPDEISQKMDEGDVDVINGVLGGTVVAKTEPQVSEEAVVQTEVNTEEEIKENIDGVEETTEIKPEVVPEVPAVNIDELEREANLAKLENERSQKEKERILVENRQLGQKLTQAKLAREEVEKQLQRQKEEQVRRESLVVPPTSEEESEFASEISKANRKLIEDIADRMGTSDPVVQELAHKMAKYEAADDARKAEEETRKQKFEDEQTQKRLYSEINEVQTKYPELKTSKPVDQLENDIVEFKKNLIHVTKVTTEIELNKAIEDYYEGGTTRELADKHGIKPVEDYQTLTVLRDLVDLKNGIKVNKYTGEDELITDGLGQKVRYGSIEEAYKISNYYDTLNKTRLESIREIGAKITQRQNAPVTLSPSETAPIEETLSPDQKAQLLNTPQKVLNANPQLQQQVDKIYAELGMEPPKHRR